MGGFPLEIRISTAVYNGRGLYCLTGSVDITDERTAAVSLLANAGATPAAAAFFIGCEMRGQSAAC
jgi:hypothetical protein